MKRFRSIKPILAALLLASPAAWATAAPRQKLHFVEHPVNETTTHLGKSTDAPGDLLTFANPVFDANNKSQVGTDQGFCIRVVRGKSWECFWTLMLRDGQITVEGPFFDTGDSHFAVTGGTGRYAGAKGEMTLHAQDTQPTGYDFIYELL
jgi:allene oxide cyclase